MMLNQDLLTKIDEANSAVARLDPAVRGEAFRILMTADSDQSHRHEMGAMREGIQHGDFFATRKGSSPAENVILTAAYLYSRYGTIPFTAEEVRHVATLVGLVIPARVDMTLLSAKRDGRALFQRHGRGRFRITVAGELHMQNVYAVSKGNEPREDGEPGYLLRHFTSTGQSEHTAV